jgi:hypothetical protein
MLPHLRLKNSGLFNTPTNPQAILKIRNAQRQVSEYQKGVCPLGWPVALALNTSITRFSFAF